MNNNLTLGQVSTSQMVGLMILAYIFSFLIRMIWVYQFGDNPNYIWNNELMINTNDGYFFASGVQQSLEGLHQDNSRVFGIWDYGVIFFTTLFVKITPFSLETVILYMPAVISSLVVIPMILIARLFKQTWWGFFSALLGSIAWSYYNRTMTGYYDTDMFSTMAPMFILFFLMKSTVDLNLRSALYAGVAIIVYPFLYDQGQAIIYAIGIIYAIYMILFHRDEKVTYSSLILVFVALMPLGILGVVKPYTYIVQLFFLLVSYFFLKKDTLEKKNLQFVSLFIFTLFLILGNVFGLILGKVLGYLATGTSEEGLHFYSVVQTVREAGSISFETFANRTSGSILGVLITLAGYVVLVRKQPVFVLALPLIGIGVFSMWGGLRFTVYAVPIAAMSAVYLIYYLLDKLQTNKERALVMLGLSLFFFLEQVITLAKRYVIPEQRTLIDSIGIVWSGLSTVVADFFKTFHLYSNRVEFYDIVIGLLFLLVAILFYFLAVKNKKFVSKTTMLLFSLAILLVPNITHVIGYSVGTVMTKAEVEDLKKLDEIADSKAYTLSWWDYGYPIWFYSDTSTLIDGGKHNNDNFIISKIMFSTSQEQVANLSRLAVERYEDSNHSVVANILFEGVKNPNSLLRELKKPDFELPQKTRDVFLYMPYKMLNIFPAVEQFGNLNLKTGHRMHNTTYSQLGVAKTSAKGILFTNGMIFDMQQGILGSGKQKIKIYKFDQIEIGKNSKFAVDSSLLHLNGTHCLVYVRNSVMNNTKMILMDRETYNSAYIQMFLLGKYDKNLFELVVSSPYSKIYRVKK